MRKRRFERDDQCLSCVHSNSDVLCEKLQFGHLYTDCKYYAAKKEEKTKLSPTHYSRLKPEPIEVMKSWFPNSMFANAIKYIARAGHKESETVEDDIKKAINYLYYYLFDRFPEFPE